MLPKVNFYFNSKQKEVLTIDNRFEQKYYYKQVLFFPSTDLEFNGLKNF